MDDVVLDKTIIALFAKDDDKKTTKQFLNAYELGIYNLGINDVVIQIEFFENENDLKNLLDELREKNSKWFLHIFGGVAHAFTNPDADDELNGLKYNRDAMHMSWKIMKNYFNRFLDEKL